MKSFTQKLEINFIGGVGEFGANSTLIQFEDFAFIVDAGVKFPTNDYFNIHFLAPDYSCVENYNINNIFLTHAHEDHIGSLQILLKKLNKKNIKIWASSFTIEVIRTKNFEDINFLDFNILDGSQSISLNNSLTLTPIELNHSIPGTLGLYFYLNNKSFSLLYLTDFRVHQSNIIETITKKLPLTEIKMLLLDFTGIYNSKKDLLSEVDLLNSFDQYLSLNRRTFIVLFPSNIHRINNILKICQKKGRYTSFVGRTLTTFIKSGLKFGLIDKDSLIQLDYKKDKNCQTFIVSGGQGTFLGSLRKIASGEIAELKIKPGDLFLFSSSIIPGNDIRISNIFDKITDQGGEVIVSNNDFPLHVTGHSSETEINQIIDEYKPNILVPIHGNNFLLKRALFKFGNKIKKIINSTSIKLSISNLNEINILSTTSNKKNLVSYDEKFNFLNPHLISQRKKLAKSGIIIVSCSSKKIHTSGLEINNEIEQELVQIINLIDISNQEKIKKEIQATLKKYLGKSPIVDLI